MPVVRLKRGRDEWLLQIPDDLTEAEAEAKALDVANGHGEGRERIGPGNGKAGWAVVSVHADHELEALRDEVEARP